MKRIKKQYINLLKPLFLFGCLFIISVSISGCVVTQRPSMLIPKDAPTPRPIRNVQVALVLGAGGARGIAHIGVIEVLEKAGIPIDLVVGSSAGSLVGALYCDNPNIQKIKHKVINIRKSDLLDPLLSALLYSNNSNRPYPRLCAREFSCQGIISKRL